MNKKLKQIAASLLSVLMIVCFMPSMAFAATDPAKADTTCHIGDVYYATLKDAVNASEDGDTIVIDSAEAGPVTIVDEVINIDVAKSGYDMKNVKVEDETVICKAENGTVTSYALHNVPAEDGGVIFNWDTSVVPATATVTFKDANGHTTKDVPAEVTYEIMNSDVESLDALCEEDLDVIYTAHYPDAEDEDAYEENKSLTIEKTGHIYAVDEADWWDGVSYDAKGIPVLKNVTVSCKNGDDPKKKADYELVEATYDKDHMPTCVEAGKANYKFKVLYDGKVVKNVKANDPKEAAKDYIIEIKGAAAKPTGKHDADPTVEPTIEYKAYVTKAEGDKVLFVSAKDAEKTVESKADAATTWTTEKTESAYAQGYDDVLTYRIGWTCKNNNCKEKFYDEPVEVKPASTVTKFYLKNSTTPQKDKDGKDITKADNCTASSVETGTFDTVKVTYAKDEYGAQKVKPFEIGGIARPAKTDYVPQHNSEGQTVDVKKPTHTEKGTKEFDCADCGNHVIVELPTIGEHTYAKDSKPVTVPPTCTEIGYTYQICEECAKADLAPVGKDGKPVEKLPSTFTTKGAIVSATTPALGHNYVVLNADKDVIWDANFTKDKDGKYCTHAKVKYECARCREPINNGEGVDFYSIDGKDAENAKYNAITYSVAKAKDCTENDTITFTVNGITDYNTKKALATDYKDKDVIGKHAYAVKTANFSADGKSVNVTIECAKDKKCLDQENQKRTISATSTASDVDAATGLTTYTASITEKDLKAAKIDAAEINTTIPKEVATKKLYDLSKATVTVPNYTDTKYNDPSYDKDKDVVVKIGNATIDPKFYTIHWPNVDAPELKAALTVSATSKEDNGITATGKSKKVLFEVTESIKAPKDAVKVTVNGNKPEDEAPYTYKYDGANKTLVATTTTKGATVSYLIDEQAADAVELKGVKFAKNGAPTSYAVKYVIRYTDGKVYTSNETYNFTITPATVKLIKPAYDKLEGQDDPAIEYDSDQAAVGDDLKLRFEKHSETPGTYKLEVECDNPNYQIKYPTGEVQYLTLTIKTDESVKAEASTAQKAAEEVTEANGYDAENVKAVADAKAKLDEAVRSGDTAAMKDATKALNEAMDAAKAAKAKAEEAAKAAEEAKAKEEATKAADTAAKAAAGVTTSAGYAKADVTAVKKAADALAAAKAKSGATAAEIQAATKALNAAVATANTNAKKAPAKVKLNKKKTKSAKKGKVTVVWKKVKGAKGYQVKVGKKTYNVKGAKKVKKIFKAKKGKRIAVKVRAYKVFKGQKIYGKWSAAKKVKIKK